MAEEALAVMITFIHTVTNMVGLTNAQADRLEVNRINSLEGLVRIGEEGTLEVFDNVQWLNASVKSQFKAFIAWAAYIKMQMVKAMLIWQNLQQTCTINGKRKE